MCKAEDGMNTAFGLTIRFIAIPRSTSRFMITTCHYLFFVHKRLTLSYIFKKNPQGSAQVLGGLAAIVALGRSMAQLLRYVICRHFVGPNFS